MEPTFFRMMLVLFAVILTVWVFINTIITKRWRNKARGEAESWYLACFITTLMTNVSCFRSAPAWVLR